MIKLGILGSTRGTNLSGIIAGIEQGELAAEIRLVISNKADAMILQRAREHHLAALFVDPNNKTREQYDKAVSQSLHEAQVELVVLIGYMRILSAEFVTMWRNKIINVHPSLLPAHAGLMDLAVHAAVIDHGNKESGCTVHYVTEEVDAGPIIIQKKCPVLPEDSPESLKSRVQSLEVPALIAAINHIANTSAS